MSDGQITLRWGTTVRTFSPGQDVTVGRDASCDIQISSPHVSRVHARVRHTGGRWEIADDGSTQGTWSGGSRIQQLPISGRTLVVLGQPGNGETLELDVVADGTVGGVIVDDDGTVGPDGGTVAADGTITAAGAAAGGSGPARPGGELRAEALAGGTVVTGDEIAIECSGRSYRFDRGREIVIGRDAGCDVVSANPTVSRRHVRILHDGTTWVLEDLGSSGGTFVERRPQTRVVLQGSVAAWLGDPETGERVVLATSGVRQLRISDKVRRAGSSGRGLVVVGALAVVAVLLSVLVFARGGGSGPSGDRLAQASVQVILENGSGSGTIVDAERGLILTNAHVAAPSSPGFAVQYDMLEPELEENPEEVLIAVTDGLNASAEVKYRAEVVAADGYLDLAVLKIHKLSSGALIEPGDLDGLVEVDLGDSAELDSGDDVRVLGYPAIADSQAPQLTEGVIGGPVRDDRMASNAAWLAVDANISGGNSGGGAFDDEGRLVGVPTLSFVQAETATKSSRIRPVDFAKPLIEKARADEPYETDYVDPVPDDAEISELSFAVGDDQDPHIKASCDVAEYDPSVGDIAVGVAFDYSGFVAADHMDIRIDVFLEETDRALIPVGHATTAESWPLEIERTDHCMSAYIPLVDSSGDLVELDNGPYVVTVSAGQNYQLLSRLTATRGGAL